MKKNYNQPEVSVAQLASMTLMQAVSSTESFGLGDIPVDDQW